MTLMPIFETMDDEDKELVREMSDAARLVMKVALVPPLNDDRVAIFDEACAVYLAASRFHNVD